MQRNQGIDAILKNDINGRPILVRVQRANETILEAANRLYRASRDKNAAAMFVVATQKGGYFEFEAQFPPGVDVIKAPALAILEALTRLENSD